MVMETREEDTEEDMAITDSPQSIMETVGNLKGCLEELVEQVENQKEALNARNEREVSLKALGAESGLLGQKAQQLELEVGRLQILIEEAQDMVREKEAEIEGLVDQLEKVQGLADEQGQMLEEYRAGREELEERLQGACDSGRRLERENGELRGEMEAILGPLEEKVREVTELNLKYEKKLRAGREENEELRGRLSKIEEELEKVTVWGASEAKSSRAKLIEEYERKLEEKDRDIRMMVKARKVKGGDESGRSGEWYGEKENEKSGGNKGGESSRRMVERFRKVENVYK